MALSTLLIVNLQSLRMTMNNRSPLLRLLLETTFAPLFIGILGVIQAIQAADGVWYDLLSIAAAFLIAISCFRPYGELSLRHGRGQSTLSSDSGPPQSAADS